VWGPRHDRETQFFYSVVGTTWMQWNKVAAVSWTKERTARLRELHARGLSSREIAHKLDVSRDSGDW